MIHPQHNYPEKHHDWPNFFRLVSISGVATICTVGNIFTISSIIVDDLLRKKGNSFLVSMTLADILVTAFLLPSMSVAILAQTEDSENLCLFQFGVGMFACVSAAIFTAVIGIENFLRIRTQKNLSARLRHGQQPVMLSVHILSQPEKQSMCSQFQITFLNLALWFLAVLFVVFHSMFMPQLTHAICDGSGSSPTTYGRPDIIVNENFLFGSLLVLGTFLLSLVLLGGLAFFGCVCTMKSYPTPLNYKTSREFALINSNLWNWLVRFLVWFPSICLSIVTQFNRSVSFMSQHEHIPPGRLSNSITSSTLLARVNSGVNSNFSTNHTSRNISNPLVEGDGSVSEQDSDYLMLQRLLFWSAILPSCLGCIVYALTNRTFRMCYVQLFNYCCCKTSVTLTRRPRDNLREGNVRVHMIPGYNIYSSGHNEVAANPPRFNTFKCGPIMSYRRDVYEL